GRASKKKPDRHYATGMEIWWGLGTARSVIPYIATGVGLVPGDKSAPTTVFSGYGGSAGNPPL
ncbi:hypothetical protein KCA24_30720, partial [Escherichia coli]|nr:hypothetical protein [Escherichia coli]